MKSLDVDLGERSYPIFIDSGALTQIENYRNYISGTNVLIVTDTNVAENYLEPLLDTLSDYNCKHISLTPGEECKNLETVSLVYDALMSERFDRNCTLIALGGGVVGDICGFAAASFQRGVTFIQVPTTLLAQVDSSVGGKTGVNHPLGKNMIGAFHQPACVVADMDVLQTLPAQELKAGLAEVIKYGLIDDAEFFYWLTENIEDLLALQTDKIVETVHRCCANKARIVAADERESGQRALLNLGHTFGHSIETTMGYGVWLHGEAVAAGMCMAARFSALSGNLDKSSVELIEKTLSAAGLPIRAPQQMTREQCLELMYRDKKVRDNVLTLVLLKGIGQAYLSNDFDEALLKESLCTEFVT